MSEWQWEYDTANLELKELNTAGRDGWEAVAVFSEQRNENGQPFQCNYVLLKRPLELMR